MVSRIESASIQGGEVDCGKLGMRLRRRVGPAVARRPPHRPVRAEFPHTVPRWPKSRHPWAHSFCCPASEPLDRGVDDSGQGQWKSLFQLGKRFPAEVLLAPAAVEPLHPCLLGVLVQLLQEAVVALDPVIAVVPT